MWSAFEDALEAAEQIGHQIREVRAVNQESRAQLEYLKREYGLDYPIPVISNSDNNLAWLLCQWLSDVASGGHNTVIDRDLAAERMKVARQKADSEHAEQVSFLSSKLACSPVLGC
jgi:hypothetical protein